MNAYQLWLRAVGLEMELAALRRLVGALASDRAPPPEPSDWLRAYA